MHLETKVSMREFEEATAVACQYLWMEFPEHERARDILCAISGRYSEAGTTNEDDRLLASIGIKL
jgi:hypothetical protein